MYQSDDEDSDDEVTLLSDPSITRTAIQVQSGDSNQGDTGASLDTLFTGLDLTRECEFQSMPKPEPEVQCCACADSVPAKNTIELKCKPMAHIYCHTCIIELFEISLHKDSTLFRRNACSY